MKKITSNFLRFGISILLLFFLLKKISIKNIFLVLAKINPLFLYVALLLFFADAFIGVLRWAILVWACGMKVGLGRLTRSYMAGLFFNLFLPSTVGGDVFRSLDLYAHTGRGSQTVATVLLDRLSGYLALVFICFVGLLIGYRQVQAPIVLLSIWILVGTCVLSCVILFNERLFKAASRFLKGGGTIKRRLLNLHQAIYLFKSHPRILAINLLYSMIIQLFFPILYYLLAKGLQPEVELSAFLILVPIINAVSMVPISIGGLGVRDLTSVVFLSKVGVRQDVALSLSLLTFAFSALLGVLGGISYVFTLRSRRLQHHKT